MKIRFPKSGAALFKWRQVAQKSQKEIAQALSVDVQLVSNAERGISQIPLSRLKILAKELKKPLRVISKVYLDEIMEHHREKIK